MKKIILNSIAILKNIMLFFLLLIFSILIFIVFFHIFNGYAFDFNNYILMISKEKNIFLYLLLILFSMAGLSEIYNLIKKK